MSATFAFVCQLAVRWCCPQWQNAVWEIDVRLGLGHIYVMNIFKRTSDSCLPRIVFWISYPGTWLIPSSLIELTASMLRL